VNEHRGKVCLRVIRSSPVMQFQDLGRYGYGHFGVSQGGAMDVHASCWANRLLGNSANATCIEVGVGNASFQVLEDSVVAICGAEMNATLDGVGIQNWGSHRVRKGQTLRLSYAQKGCYAYLAIQGGFFVEKMLGSSSMVMRNDLGVILGDGDELCMNENFEGVLSEEKLTPSRFIPDYDLVSAVRIILPSGQDRDFSDALLEAVFRISSESDRMGRNFIAENPLPALEGIISEGVSLGSVQLPPSGNPVVLLNDRQTQGGYAKVGNVARVDLPLLVQARPSMEVRFESVNRDEALKEWINFVRFFGL
jgi:5-oxoprolinase (ATP-hydrolysing) subunit C